MKIKMFIFILSLFFVGLSALPILTDVSIIQHDSLIISWKILNPENGMKATLGCYRKADRKIFHLDKEKIRGDFGNLPKKSDFLLKINSAVLP